MKKAEFKNIMKEIFREVIQEELLPLFENKPLPKKAENLKEHIIDPLKIKEMLYGNRSITTDSIENKFIPRQVNTMAEGSSLPEGNVSEEDMFKLLNPHGL